MYKNLNLRKKLMINMNCLCKKIRRKSLIRMQSRLKSRREMSEREAITEMNMKVRLSLICEEI